MKKKDPRKDAKMQNKKLKRAAYEKIRREKYVKEKLEAKAST